MTPSKQAMDTAGAVIAKIQAYDPSFATPSESVLLAWAEHLMIRNLPRDVMLDAVTKFYETNTEGAKPLPASITTIARQMRQDQLMRGDNPADELTTPHIDMREWERRHRDEFPDGFPRTLPAREIPIAPPQYRRFQGNPLTKPCPWCKAQPGEPCTVTGGGRRPLKNLAAHPSRLEQAGADPIGTP